MMSPKPFLGPRFSIDVVTIEVLGLQHSVTIPAAVGKYL
jgi:hypothetical protein